MKLHPLIFILSGICAPLAAQMPQSQGMQPQPAQQPTAGNGAAQAPENPRIMGVEIPLLDPASDTVTYNGGVFDIGNNAAVRAKFETYLNATPSTGEASALYHRRMDDIIEETRKGARTGKRQIGSKVLVRIGRTLYDLSEMPADGGQSGVLASSIVSVLDSQRASRSREDESAALDKEIDDLVRRTNNLTNRNTVGNRGGQGSIGNIKGPSRSEASSSNTYIIAHNTKTVAAKEAQKVKNAAVNLETELQAKINYQSNMASFLLLRRFDHAVIAARIYRHLFRDGDTKMQLKEDSKAGEFLTGATGLPATVSTVDSLASEARANIDRHMSAVHSMLAQNKVGEATQHLIEAVAIGEYMQSVESFPAEGRTRIARYWTLRKRALTALNARDYATVDAVAKELKTMDADFDDSMLLSYSAGRKRQSDLCIRNARKALMDGREEDFNRYITEAGTIWPLNPLLEKSAEQLESFDNNDAVMTEFRTLYARGDFRTIAKEQERFECVAVNPELKSQYKTVITAVSTVDAMLQQLETVAGQDRTMGPCIAYEKLTEYARQEPRCADDPVFSKALNDYANAAHDFVQALKNAEDCEARGEYGSALANYYLAQSYYPKSTLAAAGVQKVSRIIAEATF